MYIEEALSSYLLTQSGLTALIADRLYHITAPQDVEAPYIVYFKVSSIPERAHDGFPNLYTSRFQFSIFADTDYVAVQIKEQLQTALHCKVGLIGTSPGVYVGSCFFDNETDMFENELYHTAVDFILIHR